MKTATHVPNGNCFEKKQNMCPYQILSPQKVLRKSTKKRKVQATDKRKEKKKLQKRSGADANPSKKQSRNAVVFCDRRILSEKEGMNKQIAFSVYFID